jgi:hypothetical protein
MAVLPKLLILTILQQRLHFMAVVVALAIALVRDLLILAALVVPLV